MSAYDVMKEFLDKLEVRYDGFKQDDTSYIVVRESIGDTGVISRVLIFFYDKRNTFDILIDNIAKVEPGTSQVTQMLEVCNDFNRETSYVKMYVRDEGEVVAQITKGYEEFDPDDVISAASVVLDIIKKDYINRFMKIKWA